MRKRRHSCSAKIISVEEKGARVRTHRAVQLDSGFGIAARRVLELLGALATSDTIVAEITKKVSAAAAEADVARDSVRRARDA